MELYIIVAHSFNYEFGEHVRRYNGSHIFTNRDEATDYIENELREYDCEMYSVDATYLRLS